MASIVGLFTNKIGFLGCIVLPALLLTAMVLKDSVTSIRQQLQLIMELEQQQQVPDWQNDPLCGMTQEEYNEMYERIRAELMEELKHLVEEQTAQAAAGSEQKQSSEPKETAC